MKTLYIDTNIFLNVLFQEEGLFEASLKILNAIEQEKYAGIISLLTLMEIHRVLQKQGKKEDDIQEAISKIREIRYAIVVPAETEIIAAYEMIQQFKVDPMDAMHLAISAEAAADVFVTRDEKLLRLKGTRFNTKKPEELSA